MIIEIPFKGEDFDEKWHQLVQELACANVNLMLTDECVAKNLAHDRVWGWLAAYDLPLDEFYVGYSFDLEDMQRRSLFEIADGVFRFQFDELDEEECDLAIMFKLTFGGMSE